MVRRAHPNKVFIADPVPPPTKDVLHRPPREEIDARRGHRLSLGWNSRLVVRYPAGGAEAGVAPKAPRTFRVIVAAAGLNRDVRIVGAL